jgi:hypothetical protein
MNIWRVVRHICAHPPGDKSDNMTFIWLMWLAIIFDIYILVLSTKSSLVACIACHLHIKWLECFWFWAQFGSHHHTGGMLYVPLVKLDTLLKELTHSSQELWNSFLQDCLEWNEIWMMQNLTTCFDSCFATSNLQKPMFASHSSCFIHLHRSCCFGHPFLSTQSIIHLLLLIFDEVSCEQSSPAIRDDLSGPHYYEILCGWLLQAHLKWITLVISV